MPYKSYQLKDLYSYIIEQDTEALGISEWFNLSPKMLEIELGKMKRTNPVAYGSLLVKLYQNPRSRVALMNAIT